MPTTTNETDNIAIGINLNDVEAGWYTERLPSYDNDIVEGLLVWNSPATFKTNSTKPKENRMFNTGDIVKIKKYPLGKDDCDKELKDVYGLVIEAGDSRFIVLNGDKKHSYPQNTSRVDKFIGCSDSEKRNKSFKIPMNAVFAKNNLVAVKINNDSIVMISPSEIDWSKVDWKQ